MIKFILLISFTFPLYAQIKKDWGVSYDDYFKQTLVKYKIDFENIKNYSMIEIINDITVLTIHDTELSLSYTEVTPLEGILYIKNSSEVSEYFIRIVRSQNEIDPSEIKDLNLPHPELGETIRYNFNNSYEVVWRNDINQKFLSISKGNFIYARFMSENTEQYERLKIDFLILVGEIVDFRGEIYQEKNPLLPLSQTYFRKFQDYGKNNEKRFEEISFFQFMKSYNALPIQMLDGFVTGNSPFSRSSPGKVTIHIGN